MKTTLAIAVFASALAAGACQTPSGPSSSRSLEGTYWKAIAIASNPIPAQEAAREAHLLFQATSRVSGADGCNRVSGSYELDGDAIAFGQLATTRMACPNTGEIERAFHGALSQAARWRRVDDRLDLLGPDGTTLAAFEARPPN